MPLMPNRFREQVQGVSGYINEALDGMSASFEALWDREHKPSGGHGDITADTITLGGTRVPKSRTYTPTLADVNNTTTETAYLQFYVDAGDMADGDTMEIFTLANFFNNTGGIESFSSDISWGGVEGDMGGGSPLISLNDNASIRPRGAIHILRRKGNSLFTFTTTAGNNEWEELTGVTFATKQLVSLRGTLSIASANLYYKPVLASVLHVSLT